MIESTTTTRQAPSNPRSSDLSLSKALVGFLNTKAGEGLSPRTLTNYEFRLWQWIDFAGDATAAWELWQLGVSRKFYRAVDLDVKSLKVESSNPVWGRLRSH